MHQEMNVGRVIGVCLLSLLISSCLGQTEYEGRYCTATERDGYFGFDMFSSSRPRDATSPSEVEFVSYGYNRPNYICTDRGELLLSASWSLDSRTSETEWLTLDLSHMGDDWLFVDEVSIWVDREKIASVSVQTERGETYEGLPIEHMYVPVSPEELFTIINADWLAFSFGGLNELSVVVPAEGIFNLRTFAERVRRSHTIEAP